MGINNKKSSTDSYNSKPQACLSSTSIYCTNIEMNRDNLSKMTKQQLTDMLLKQSPKPLMPGKPKLVTSSKPKSLVQMAADRY